MNADQRQRFDEILDFVEGLRFDFHDQRWKLLGALSGHAASHLAAAAKSTDSGLVTPAMASMRCAIEAILYCKAIATSENGYQRAILEGKVEKLRLYEKINQDFEHLSTNHPQDTPNFEEVTATIASLNGEIEALCAEGITHQSILPRNLANDFELTRLFKYPWITFSGSIHSDPNAAINNHVQTSETGEIRPVIFSNEPKEPLYEIILEQAEILFGIIESYSDC